jgi:hypothetical protein
MGSKTTQIAKKIRDRLDERVLAGAPRPRSLFHHHP